MTQQDYEQLLQWIPWGINHTGTQKKNHTLKTLGKMHCHIYIFINFFTTREWSVKYWYLAKIYIYLRSNTDKIIDRS